MGLFRKGKTRITAKLHRTDLIICTHSKEGNTSSYSRINMVGQNKTQELLLNGVGIIVGLSCGQVLKLSCVVVRNSRVF